MLPIEIVTLWVLSTDIHLIFFNFAYLSKLVCGGKGSEIQGVGHHLVGAQPRHVLGL